MFSCSIWLCFNLLYCTGGSVELDRKILNFSDSIRMCLDLFNRTEGLFSLVRFDCVSVSFIAQDPPFLFFESAVSITAVAQKVNFLLYGLTVSQPPHYSQQNVNFFLFDSTVSGSLHSHQTCRDSHRCQLASYCSVTPNVPHFSFSSNTWHKTCCISRWSGLYFALLCRA